MSSFNTAAQRVQREIKKIVKKRSAKMFWQYRKTFWNKYKNFYCDKRSVYSFFIYTNLFLQKFSRIHKYFITLQMR